MGNLKVMADGSNTLILKDNTEMVAGSKAGLTGGNFALVTAGAMEDVVLGFLMTGLLGGELKVAQGGTLMDGKATKLYGRKTGISALSQRVTWSEQTIAMLTTRVSGTEDTLAQVDGQTTTDSTDVTAMRTAVGDIDIATLTSRIRQIASEAYMISTSVRTIANELLTAEETTTVREVETTMGGTCANLFDLTQMV
jgi:hypothetical protein